MFRTKKVPLHSIFIISILILVCLIAVQYIPRNSRSSQHVQPQNTPAILREVAMTNPTPAKVRDSTRLQVEAGFGNLPLAFEPNRGQTDPRVKFLARAGNRTLWLTSDEAVLAVGRLPRPIGPDTKQAAAAKEIQSAPAVLRMKFVGANATPTIDGEAKQSGTINYFTGEPDQWRTKIPIYARVRYHSLYPGIDLVFYGNNRELEYDLVVASGADPGQIKLAVAGARNIRIDGEGNLVLETPTGDVIQQKPKIYQRSGTTLKPVSGDYVLTAKNEVGFRVGSYDRRAAVVIDPVLRYSTFLSGSSFDNGSSIAVDSQNRAVVAGETCSQDFPVTGSSTPTGCSAFIVKLDFTGSRLIFAAFLPDNFHFPQLALDPAGNAYVLGSTRSAQFPTTPGAFQRTFGGVVDDFVVKLNANGTALVYSTFLGGSGEEGPGGIAVDASGNAYVTGGTESTNFPTTPGSFQHECALRNDGSCANAFITKLNANGSKLLYSTFLGGHGSQGGRGIAIDREGHAFITGGTQASDFPTTAGTAQPVFGGVTDAFVSEVSSSGSHLIYSTYLGGTDEEGALAIALDAEGNAFITGSTTSPDFPVKNPFQTFERHCTSAGTVCVMNVFVSKLNPNGRLVYSTYLDGGIQGTGIAVTPGGQAYVAAFTQIDTFPITQTAFQRVLAGGVDNTLTKFSPTGKLIYSTFLGGNGGDFDPAVALDRDTNAYMTGTILSSSTASSTFPVTPGAFQQKSRGGGDGFVAKIVSLCALSTANRSVTICSPASGSTVASPVRIIAGTTDVTPVKLTQVYLDGKKIYETGLSAINVGLPIAAGTHRLTVQGLDTASVFFKKSISINVSPH